MKEIFPTGFWSGSSPFHAISKPLADWIIEYLMLFNDKPVYDFGCGTGMYLARLKEAGFTDLCGFEGDPPSNKVFENIKKQDLTLPFAVPKKGNVISLEVAEHIPTAFTGTYLNNIRNACEVGGKFICSWALRGQGGDGHCNELNNDEAISLIVSKGFEFLEKDTESARENIIAGYQNIPDEHLPWFKNTTLIFEKK